MFVKKNKPMFRFVNAELKQLKIIFARGEKFHIAYSLTAVTKLQSASRNAFLTYHVACTKKSFLRD